jgi:hypothetical protein
LQSTTLEAAKFNARLINRASDLIEEEKLFFLFRLRIDYVSVFTCHTYLVKLPNNSFNSTLFILNSSPKYETQAGLITLAAKAALEIHKQISKSTQSPATTGGVSGLKKVPGV